MSVEAPPASIELTIPCKPEFVGIARLTVLGVASRMSFSYDEVEDLRLAVGEACTTAVERAMTANKTDTAIDIQSVIQDNKLTIEVRDHAGQTGERPSADVDDDLDEQGLGVMLMELLVDEFVVEPTEDGTLVRMAKYAE